MAGVTVLLMFIFLVLQTVVSSSQHNSNTTHAEPEPRCYFVFGDSMSDNGNNNLLRTRAKVNYPPYGIDAFDGPTGRFSNGRNMVDSIARLLGFTYPIPPFTDSWNSDIFRGVNYASGAAGIREETGHQLGDVFSLGRQLIHHQITLWRMITMQGDIDTTVTYLNKCLYTVYIGNNDYINNYFQPNFYPTSRTYPQERYADALIQQYAQYLRVLYSYGARKIVLFGLGPLGCSPYAINNFGTDGGLCVEDINCAVKSFNQRLVSLVDQLNHNLTNAKFTYVNPGTPSRDILVSSGLNITNTGCCRVSRIGQCVPYQTPCHNRSLYLYWDAFHPTEKANEVMANIAFTSINSSEVYPYNISRLIRM